MIFISYRRADSESVVGRLYSELKKHFPTQDVFLDHDSIPFGKPFFDVICERLATTKFALVLIGPQWCSIKDEKTGQRRLDDPNDYVRLEVEATLATPGVDVIPLWVMRATTTPEDIAFLPTSLQPLFNNQGMSLRPVPDEANDLQRLIGRLARQTGGQHEVQGPKRENTPARQRAAFLVGATVGHGMGIVPSCGDPSSLGPWNDLIAALGVLGYDKHSITLDLGRILKHVEDKELDIEGIRSLLRLLSSLPHILRDELPFREGNLYSSSQQGKCFKQRRCTPIGTRL
jgi:hypothetical protein